HEASMVYPVTTGFHWGRVDFLWYIEGCRSRPKNAGNSTGFHDVNTFINYPVHEKAGNQTIPDYVKMIVNDEKTSLHTPLEISQQLHKHADTAMQLLSSLEDGGNAELQVTLYDIKTISLMGKYYAHKIAGSTYVALYRETKDKSYQTKAVSELTEALDFWKQYVDVAMEQNINPIWTNRVGNVDWVKATEWAQQDIKIAQAD
ncbi:MAG: carbohydrate-binding family 6 protein, partial [Bacteroidota bacterium]